jgi:ferredoxin
MNGLKQKISDYAKMRGADLVGFSSIDRFKDLPREKNPLTIFPEAKTVIGLGFRVLRGMLRGIEEGSTFYHYTTLGIELLEEVYMPNVMLEVCSRIEDMGYTGVPQKRMQLILDDEDENSTNPEMNYQEIYRNAKQSQLDFTYTALACGLGELGMSGAVLTDEFGPFQRFCFILTDAIVDEDKLYEPHLCDKCGLCSQACPGQALGREDTYTVLPVPEYKIYKLDTWQCAAYTQGANMQKNPFMPGDALSGMKDRMDILKGKKRLSPGQAKSVMDQLVFYPLFRHGYAMSVCGRACDRACYSHLEKRAVLNRSFVNRFRNKDEWKLDIIAE